MQRNEIILYRDQGSWMAWYKGPHVARLRSAGFAADVLPTAYLAGAAAETVRLAIASRNPDVAVTVKP